MILALTTLLDSGCHDSSPDAEMDADAEMDLLMTSIEGYETAWAAGDFLKVDSFFADNAKRLHTEPYVWDREDITEFCRERAAQSDGNLTPVANNDWKKDREYLEIRVEGNIAYDIFTTDRFKALHIWEKQNDGSWKILYDVGFLHQTEERPKSPSESQTSS
ncbi:hypothetical protein Q31b_25100 [Novipirellula aureliae]|uniref:DUF4440 domain-containing protein n=2 Tax=Novipirellula aureliae TaxID=2527966 RepID=A0A5C6E8C5_9BACT|nr:hypothetical protein Q31b_25100 [Novipirellula aureliae]